MNDKSVGLEFVMGRGFSIAIVVGVSLCATTVSAHPGAQILTAGASKERVAMTSGMTYEDVNGIHIFRGRAALAGGGEKILMRRTMTKIKLSVAAPRCAYRSCARMRTQGFYSGNKHQSRRYTQGFYSGR